MTLLDFICFICFNIKIRGMLNVECKSIRPRALYFVLSVNKKGLMDFFFREKMHKYFVPCSWVDVIKKIHTRKVTLAVLLRWIATLLKI